MLTKIKVYLLKRNDNNKILHCFQVGRSDLRLISPDRKLVLLHRQHRDVANCVHGIASPEHFGFICREHSNQQNQQQHTYVGYVFKCESASVASDAVNAVSQALTTIHQLQPDMATIRMPGQLFGGSSVTTCEHCPMVWYGRLCSEIENLSERKTQAAILRKLEQLDENEQQIVLAKWRGAEPEGLRDQNEFLMMLLRAHCEAKQQRHVHDTAENRSEFLSQYLGVASPSGSASGLVSPASGTHQGIFTKAKRSFSVSLDNLLKRKGSRDDIALAARPQEIIQVR